MQRYWRTNEADIVSRVALALNGSRMTSAGLAIEGSTMRERVSLLSSGSGNSVSNRPKLDTA